MRRILAILVLCGLTAFGANVALVKDSSTHNSTQQVQFTGAVKISELIVNGLTTKTVSSGAITIDLSAHKVAGEGAAADDLDTISGGTSGQVLFLLPSSSSQDITLKHGTGNILTANTNDFVIPDNGFVVLVYDGSNWHLDQALTHENGGLEANVSAYDGLVKISGGATSAVAIGTAANNIVERSALNTIATDTITESTGAAGVTIDGVIHKDDEVTDVNLLNFDHDSGTKDELTIASDAITVTLSVHAVDTESDGATDDLATISGGTVGDVLYLYQINAGHDITIKHGTGNVYTPDGADFTMSDYGITCLIFDGSYWRIVQK